MFCSLDEISHQEQVLVVSHLLPIEFSTHPCNDSSGVQDGIEETNEEDGRTNKGGHPGGHGESGHPGGNEGANPGATRVETPVATRVETPVATWVETPAVTTTVATLAEVARRVLMSLSRTRKLTKMTARMRLKIWRQTRYIKCRWLQNPHTI
jgi:hypothetical protein